MNELERLLVFLDRLQTLLLHALQHRTELMTPSMEQSFAALAPICETRMEALRAEVQGANPVQRAQLVRNGLTGPELDAKLAGFDAAFAGFEATQFDPQRQPDTGQFRWAKWLKKGFGWGNIILGSFASIFSAKDAVEEIKKVIEQGIEDGEDYEYVDGNVIFPRTW